jgi:hypothetical protein
MIKIIIARRDIFIEIYAHTPIWHNPTRDCSNHLWKGGSGRGWEWDDTYRQAGYRTCSETMEPKRGTRCAPKKSLWDINENDLLIRDCSNFRFFFKVISRIICNQEKNTIVVLLPRRCVLEMFFWVIIIPFLLPFSVRVSWTYQRWWVMIRILPWFGVWCN